MKEITLSSKTIYSGRILTLRNEKVRLPNGQISDREIIDHDPAVVIIPFQPPDTLYVIRQYRKAIEQVILEFPAGIIEKSESPFDAAKRELQEETGLIANALDLLYEGYPSPGFCNELMSFYVATDFEFSTTNLDDDETIEVLTVTLDEFEQQFNAKKIIDGKTAFGYFLLKNYLNQQSDG